MPVLLRRTSTGKQITGKGVFLVFLRPAIVVRGGVRPMAVQTSQGSVANYSIKIFKHIKTINYHGSRPKAEGFRWRECCERSELGGRLGCGSPGVFQVPRRQKVGYRLNFFAVFRRSKINKKPPPPKSFKISRVGPRSAQGGPVAPCWKAFHFSFRLLFATFSRMGRFSKIRTAPTRELCFRGSSLSKSIHVGLYFRFRLRLRVRCYPEPRFGAIYVDSVPKMGNFRSPLGPLGCQMAPRKGTQEPPRAKNEPNWGTRRRLIFRLCSENAPDRLFGMFFAFILAYFLLRFRPRFGAVGSARRVSQGARTSTNVPIVLGPPCNNSARKAHCNAAT